MQRKTAWMNCTCRYLMNDQYDETKKFYKKHCTGRQGRNDCPVHNDQPAFEKRCFCKKPKAIFGNICEKCRGVIPLKPVLQPKQEG